MTERVANVTGPFSSVQRRMFGCGTTAGKWTIDGPRLMPMMIRTALHHSSAAETAEANGPSCHRPPLGVATAGAACKKAAATGNPPARHVPTDHVTCNFDQVASDM